MELLVRQEWRLDCRQLRLYQEEGLAQNIECAPLHQVAERTQRLNT
jgi:hypothetical protein